MSYTPTVWKSGDVVSSLKLNKLENGLATAANGLDELSNSINASIYGSPLNISIASNDVYEQDIFVKAGGRICILGGSNDSRMWLAMFFSDGSYIESIALKVGLNYRTAKDIVKIRIYNGATSTVEYTITIYPDTIPITNYYDSDSAQSGYISGASIQSGYYHSDYIPVAIGDKLIYDAYPGTFGNSRVYFYDDTKTYAGYITGTLREDGLYELTLTTGTVGSNFYNGKIFYAAINLTSIGAEDARFYINEVPETALAYGQDQPDKALFFNKQQRDYIDDTGENAVAYTDDTLADIVTHETSANLFDMNSDLTEIGKFWQNGSKNNLSGYAVSNPIEVKIGDVLLYNKSVSNLYGNIGEYVDAEGNGKAVINSSSVETTDEGYTKLVATRNNFVQFNLSTGNMSTLMIVKNTTMPESYVAFKDKYVFTDKVDLGTIETYESPIKGKRIAYNGDSIAESRISEGNAYNGGAYAKMIADIAEGSYENRAISGGILASAPGDGGSTPNRCVVSDVANMTDDADLICFEGGINDYWRKVPLGTYSESDYTGTLDTTTICGALESIFRQAKSKWIGKPIVFVITHKITSTVYTQNTAGYDWRDVHEEMVGICRKYAIPYYDAFEESGLNAYDSVQNTNFLTSNSSGTPDGCHPNAAGYQKYYVPQLIALFESVMPRA